MGANVGKIEGDEPPRIQYLQCTLSIRSVPCAGSCYCNQSDAVLHIQVDTTVQTDYIPVNRIFFKKEKMQLSFKKVIHCQRTLHTSTYIISHNLIDYASNTPLINHCFYINFNSSLESGTCIFQALVDTADEFGSPSFSFLWFYGTRRISNKWCAAVQWSLGKQKHHFENKRSYVTLNGSLTK